ncbi:MAG: enoyl-CoA hydratase-related protein [bacterium]
MKNYQTIEIEIIDQVCTVWLNRQEKHNAFNEMMLIELTDCFEHFDQDEILCIILRGRGKSFCAGVDLNWLKEGVNNDSEQNYRESLLLSECFYTIYSCGKPTIALVHGSSLGGANGLLAACDLAYCTEDAVFSLSEVKIGIVPACISPYIIKRVGEYKARELMLTGRRFSGREAEAFHLVNKSFPAGNLDLAVEEILPMIRTSGPKAMSQCKTLIFEVSNNLSLSEAYDFTARMIADLRVSEEGQEGMKAFLEKRKPGWIR